MLLSIIKVFCSEVDKNESVQQIKLVNDLSGLFCDQTQQVNKEIITKDNQYFVQLCQEKNKSIKIDKENLDFNEKRKNENVKMPDGFLNNDNMRIKRKSNNPQPLCQNVENIFQDGIARQCEYNLVKGQKLCGENEKSKNICKNGEIEKMRALIKNDNTNEISDSFADNKFGHYKSIEKENLNEKKKECNDCFCSIDNDNILIDL